MYDLWHCVFEFLTIDERRANGYLPKKLPSYAHLEDHLRRRIAATYAGASRTIRRLRVTPRKLFCTSVQRDGSVAHWKKVAADPDNPFGSSENVFFNQIT